MSRYCFPLLTVIAIIAIPIFARTGGPDLYGYTFYDSEEPSIEFSWLDTTDLTEIYIPVESDSDDVAMVVHLPFTFMFYGEEYDSLWISTNGLITFIPNCAEAYDNVEMPSLPMPNACIAPLWDDQKPYGFFDTLEVGIYYFSGGTEPERWFCIEWINFFPVSYTHLTLPTN